MSLTRLHRSVFCIRWQLWLDESGIELIVHRPEYDKEPIYGRRPIDLRRLQLQNWSLLVSMDRPGLKTICRTIDKPLLDWPDYSCVQRLFVPGVSVQ